MNDSFIGNRIKDRFRASSQDIQNISQQVFVLEKEVNKVSDEVGLTLQADTSIVIEDIPEIKEEFELTRDHLSETLITLASTRDKLFQLFSKLEARAAHNAVSAEHAIKLSELIASVSSDLVKFRGNFNQAATIVMSLMDNEMFQQLIASDDAASHRMLEIIGKKRVGKWLISKVGSEAVLETIGSEAIDEWMRQKS